MKKSYNLSPYLERHLEPERKGSNDRDQLLGTEGPLYEPLADTQYDVAGAVQLHADGGAVRINYTYSPVERFIFTGNNPIKKDSYRNLDTIVISNLETNVSQDIMQFLPQGYKVTFAVADPEWGYDMVDVTESNKIIQITSGLLSPASFFALCHEIGHAVDHERDKRLYEQVFKEHRGIAKWVLKGKGVEFYESWLTIERNAWAGGLSMMRPILSTDPERLFSKANYKQKSAAMRMAHEWSLQSYSNGMRKEYSKTPLDRVHELGETALSNVMREMARVLYEMQRVLD